VGRGADAPLRLLLAALRHHVAPIWVGPATQEEDLFHSREGPTRCVRKLLAPEKRTPTGVPLMTTGHAQSGRSNHPTG